MKKRQTLFFQKFRINTKNKYFSSILCVRFISLAIERNRQEDHEKLSQTMGGLIELGCGGERNSLFNVFISQLILE